MKNISTKIAATVAAGAVTFITTFRQSCFNRRLLDN